MKIFLASSSPRRRQLLQLLFSQFSVYSPDIDESCRDNELPRDYCIRISEEKNYSAAKKISDICNEDCLIISSDTIVTIENIILQKPANREEAFQMLSFLSGKAHKVMSSITISLYEGKFLKKILTENEETRVIFKLLPEELIDNYLSKTNYIDKAGAYAIQENGEMIVESYKGSFSNIVGLPMSLIIKMLFQFEAQDLFF